VVIVRQKTNDSLAQHQMEVEEQQTAEDDYSAETMANTHSLRFESPKSQQHHRGEVHAQTDHHLKSVVEQPTRSQR